MSFEYLSDKEDFFCQYFKNESILLQKENEEEIKIRKKDIILKDGSLDSSKAWIMTEK